MPRALFLLCLIAAGLAAGEAPFLSDAEWNSARPAAPSGPGMGAIAGILASLVGVIALALALAWAVKRFGLQRVLPGRGRHIEVVESVGIGPKRSVTLLRLGDQVLVVGQAEHGVTHLATLPASVLGTTTPAAPAAPEPPKDQRFAGLLMQLTGKKP